MYRSKEKYNEYMRNYYKKNNNAGKKHSSSKQD